MAFRACDVAVRYVEDSLNHVNGGISVSVELDIKKLKKAWRETRDGTLNVLIVVDAAAGADVEAILLDAVAIPGTSEEATFHLAPPVPVPQGWAVLVYHSDDLADLLIGLEAVRERIEAEGLSGRLTIFNNQWTPLQNPLHPIVGVAAGLSLKGTPAGTEIEQAHGNGTTWIPDPAALSKVVAHALDWTHVEDGTYWITAGLTSFLVHEESRQALFEELVPRASWPSIVSEVDGQVRSVTFDTNGHVIYERGSKFSSVSVENAEELKDVLADLKDSLDYGLILRVSLPLVAWGSIHSKYWFHVVRELVEQPPAVAIRRDLEPFKVGNAYPVQLLGPRHDLPSAPEGWTIEDLADGYRFLIREDLSAWVEVEPDVAGLASARLSLASILADPWIPTPRTG